MIEIKVNGVSQVLQEPVHVSDLISRMSLQGKRIAVEVNGEIVPASQHSQHLLASGDQVEVVGAIGGG